MHDFIEKPSRMILFVISVIALVTIIILLSKSRLIDTGGESLVDANGKRIEAKPTPIPAAIGNNTATGNGTQEEHIEVYIEDDTVNNGADTWVEAEMEDETQTPAGQAEETVVIEDNTEPAQEENTAPEAETEDVYAGTEDTNAEASENGQAEVWDEVEDVS